MWPCKNEGENARLYNAVKGASDFAISIGVNIPTGKDSMSMTQKYPNGDKVLSPGTLIISATGQSSDIRKTLHASLVTNEESTIYYIPFVKDVSSEESFPLGGTAYAQTVSLIGSDCADIKDPIYFKKCFNRVQKALFDNGHTPALACHDISAGGMVTTLLEMCFPCCNAGMKIDLREFNSSNILLSEVPGIILQVSNDERDKFESSKGDIACYRIGYPTSDGTLSIEYKADGNDKSVSFGIEKAREIWYRTSYLFDSIQTGESFASERYANYTKQPLKFTFPTTFSGKYHKYEGERKTKAAIIRETGSNGLVSIFFLFLTVSSLCPLLCFIRL